MARTRVPNPLAFRRTPVTFIGTISYIALFTALLWTHTTVPSAPSNPAPAPGINLTQAWLDLEFISDGYHPWGSQRNEVVRKYLLDRIHEILEANGADYKTVYAGLQDEVAALGKKKDGDKDGEDDKDKKPKPGASAVTVFAEDTSNFTSWDHWTKQPWTIYGESQNLLVYIRGELDDSDSEWWLPQKNTSSGPEPFTGTSGVLVNAHYDSVSSGFGATDDGVGVVTVLQLISHFSLPERRPKRGIVALLNNGEEDGLYGAMNYLRHPLSAMPHTFLNLEGAGAGGRATLFRSSDAEVTRAYARSPRPFGTVVSGDGFKRGLVKSGTDYSVFTDLMGLRGLDVAFFEPRARYHTNEDGARDTSPDSVWHMLSASLATMEGLTSYTGEEFEGSTDKWGKIDSGSGNDGVWFDLFGRAFAVVNLHTMFAFSVTLLVAGPVLLVLSELLIRRSGKWYLLARRKYHRSLDEDDAVHIHGRRGVFRFPVAVAIASAAVIALAFLLTKINPLILYSSEYAVWGMMLSIWFAIAWFLFAGAANVRPTALQRMYSLIWLYAVSWVMLVLATVGENNFHLGSGYFVVIFNASVFVALLISNLELLSLPKISKYVERVLNARGDERSFRSGGRSSSRVVANENADGEAAVTEEEQPTERTSLLQGEQSRRSSQTFTAFRRKRPDRDEVPEDVTDPLLNAPYLEEQAWSTSLLRWTWFLQFLVLVPINVIIIGQISLLVTSSLHQTPADGNSVLTIYILMAVLTVLLLLPLTPFIHRFTYRVPTLLFLIAIGCLIYNLTAFPFSRDARMKFYFIQTMDLDTGANKVSLTGIGEYLQDIIDELPSAAAGEVQCGEAAGRQSGLETCSWSGLLPNLVPTNYLSETSENSTKLTHRDWLNYNITSNGRTATIGLRGLNSKVCYLQFEEAVSEVRIQDSGRDARLRTVSEDGSSMIKLFSRDWDKLFNVTVIWSDAPAKGQKGRAICAWSDVNQHGTIPAYDEVLRFQPVWTAVTKASTGLVEGWKDFEV